MALKMGCRGRGSVIPAAVKTPDNKLAGTKPCHLVLFGAIRYYLALLSAI